MRFLKYFLREMNKSMVWIKRLCRNDKDNVKSSVVRKRKKQGNVVNII